MLGRGRRRAPKADDKAEAKAEKKPAKKESKRADGKLHQLDKLLKDGEYYFFRGNKLLRQCGAYSFYVGIAKNGNMIQDYKDNYFKGK